jgi:multidrug efflux pump subunit AcrA (membrane-fusion protein)
VNDEAVTGRVRTLVPTRQTQSRTVEAVVVLEAEMNGIRRGDLARLELTMPVAAEGFLLPKACLTEGTRGLWACYVAEPTDDGHVLARRDLQILHADDRGVFVTGTLAPGDLVVIDGVHRLTPGLPVRVAEAGE